MADVPTWSEVRRLVARELGEPVSDGEPLTSVRRSRMTWAARAPGAGPIVVKIRDSDEGRAQDKTRWCAAHLPVLAARGYPAPTILCQGMVGDGWHVFVQHRLPGRPLTSLDGPMPAALLRLVELQADAGIAAGERDFAGYLANVLFDDWE
ncbi:MAG TPA: hypothetical protein VG756_10855 [Pseudonocardiaceae bacterium]|nr:hypothetical protein [Pseudonocardiaceae bacterium]